MTIPFNPETLSDDDNSMSLLLSDEVLSLMEKNGEVDLRFQETISHLIDQKVISANVADQFYNMSYTVSTSREEPSESFEVSGIRGLNALMVYMYLRSYGYTFNENRHGHWMHTDDPIFRHINPVLSGAALHWGKSLPGYPYSMRLETVGEVRRIAALLVFMGALLSLEDIEANFECLSWEYVSKKLSWAWIENPALASYVANNFDSAAELGTFMRERGLGASDEDTQFIIEWNEGKSVASVLKNGSL